MSLRAAIYARVSTDDQRGNYSIPTQIQDALGYAEKKGYSIVGDSFVDPETGRDVSSGGNGNIAAFVDDFSSREISRPGIDAVYSFLESVGFDILVVHSLDRLARDPYIRQTIEIELQERGASVEYILGNYDASPEGEVRKDLDATFAKWENVKRVERSLRGKRGKAESGKFVGGKPPYGYELDEKAQAGLAVLEEEAEVVREIFELYGREGLSIRGITEHLTDRGVSSPTGRPSWGKSTVSKILRNETYIGTNHYNKFKRQGKAQVERAREDWIPIETTPIVDPHLFREVQEKLRRNKAARRKEPRRFYLLGGMVFCPDCGRPYATQTQKAGRNRRLHDAPSYRHRSKEGHCRNRTISARKVDPVVWDRIAEVLLDPANLRKGYEESLDQQQATTKRQRQRLETLERARLKHDQKAANLMTAYLDPDIQMTKPEYLKQRTAIEDELVTLADEIETIRAQLDQVEVPPEFETIEAFANEVRDQLDGESDLTPQAKRQIFELLHVKVFIPEEGELWLEGWFDPPRERQSITARSGYDRLLPQPRGRV